MAPGQGAGQQGPASDAELTLRNGNVYWVQIRQCVRSYSGYFQPLIMKLVLLSLLVVWSGFSAYGQTKPVSIQDGRPEIGRYCKVYQAGEGLKLYLLRIGPESNNETLVGLDGFDHPWDGKIFKSSVVTADKRQEFTIQNNGRPFVVLVMRERYGPSTLFVPKYGTPQPERPVVYSESLSAECKPDVLLSQYLSQQAKK